MRVIDAHHHLWALDTPGHEWPTAQEPLIHRDFVVSQLVEASREVPLRGTVLVQSQPTDADTDWMLGVAEDCSLIAAVIGWTECDSPTAADRIARLAASSKLRGLRPMLQAIPDTDWLLRPAVARALDAMERHGLRLDALVQPRHLPMLARFMDQRPDLPLVIDHGAKPFVAAGLLDPWRAQISALAERGAWCKLSGLRTEQAPGAPTEALQPYVDHLIACFGDRLMWGSDWPVSMLVGDDYAQTWRDADRLARLEGAPRDRLFSGAAAAFYGLEV